MARGLISGEHEQVYFFLIFRALRVAVGISNRMIVCDRICGLVVGIPGYRSEVRVRFPELPDFWEVMGLERSPLSLVSTIEELLERKSSGCGLENQQYGHRDPSC
jgi:hypothetical protein